MSRNFGRPTIFETLIEFLDYYTSYSGMSKSKELRDAETGYVYDWIRQKQKENREKIKKHVKTKKRINKLTKKNKVVKHR